MDSSRVKVLLVDDHQMIVESFSSLLELDDRFEVAGTALSAEEGAELVEQLRPDVAVFDVDFPGRDSFDVVPQLTRKSPSTSVMFLTGHLSDIFVSQAIRMGARGYLLKEESTTAVRDAIFRVAQGEFAFTDVVRDRLSWNEDSQAYEVRSDSMLCGLSIQQLAILRHLARGESVKQIAALLDRSEKSIDSHKYRIMHKLGIHDRVELCRYAIREGLTVV